MIYGFTGTRNGMNAAQKNGLVDCVLGGEISEFHHGCCRGADAEASRIVMDISRIRTEPIRIVGRPGPVAPEGVWDELMPPKTYFARNRDIVNACQILVSAPPLDIWLDRGGTFYTLGYAIKVKTSLIILWPDGRVERR